ncbi:MAG: phosphopentomutase [Fusobacteriaceae bacterium]
MRATMIVLDSLGVGTCPDSKKYFNGKNSDEGANTLSHIAEVTGGLNLPNMQKLGLGNITNVKGVAPEKNPLGCYGKAQEKALGKDTTSGHWEMVGIIPEKGFPTYANGFPAEVIKMIEEQTGRKVLCNLPYSGTQVIDDYGDEQLKTGAWIIYTSADPVLQIAAHEEIIPLEELYKACEISLEICKKHSPIARVIARPYLGTGKGDFKRTSNRHDFSVLPPEESSMDRIKNSGLDVISVGKISDIFAGVGVTDNRKSNKDNLDGILKTIEALKEKSKGFIFTNLVDFDMAYGHRRDPVGYKKALEEFDRYLPEIMKNMQDDEILILTADHGCDPTWIGTDHTREYIPIIVYGKNIKQGINLGTRESFSDIGATIEELLLGKSNKVGKSFLGELRV